METTGGRPEGRGMSVSMVAEWRIARNLFPIYAELVRQSGQCPPPFSSFGSDDRPESLEAVRRWFDEVDAGCSPAQFRGATDAVVGVNDTAWHAIALHFLAMRRADPDSRKKLAFVLTRYFAICCPPSFRTKNISRRHVADVLQPLIGDCADPDEIGPSPADELFRRLEKCGGLTDLTAVARDAESLEQAFGDRYLTAAALSQATHLHYVVHLSAAERLQTHSSQLVKQLKTLRERGIDSLDARAAGMSEKEPIDGIIRSWSHWSAPSDVEYRLEEVARVLLGLDKALAAMQASSPDARVDGELVALRALAEKLGSQLSSVTQRLQRLESMIDLQGTWTPSPETIAATNKFHITPPPVVSQAGTMTPIAARPTARTMTDPQQSSHPSPPGNGNYRP